MVLEVWYKAVDFYVLEFQSVNVCESGKTVIDCESAGLTYSSLIGFGRSVEERVGGSTNTVRITREGKGTELCSYPKVLGTKIWLIY